MRHGRLLTAAALLLTLFLAGAAKAATEFAGTYHAPKITLQLATGAGGYTGTLTINDAPYPVTAKETDGALTGSFSSQGANFNFDAQLKGDILTLHSSGKTFELKRDAPKPVGPANPFDQVPAGPTTQPGTPAPPAIPTPPAAPKDPVELPTGEAALSLLRNLGAPQVDPKRDWLLLDYIDGDNNIEQDALEQIKEMERGLPDTGVEMIVLFDRPIKKMKNGYLNHPILYRIRKHEHADYLDSQVLRDLGAIDMADPKTLAAFIEGALKAYPAQQHALFTWDHGGTWKALTIDEFAPGKPNNFDAMDMLKFRDGVSAGMQAGGLKKWDILTFDMCLMCQLEVAAQIHDLTDVMVASEALEPAPGMPYTEMLQTFGKGTLGGRRIGGDMVIAFDKYHKERGIRSTTMAALDMSAFDEVNAKLNAVTDKLIPVMPKAWQALAKSCFYGEQYADSRSDFRNGANALQSVDLMDILKKLRSAMPDFPAEAEYKDLRQTMDRFVIASANSDRRRMSNGLAIYAPVIQEAYSKDYEKLIFHQISHWPQLFQALYTEEAQHNAAPKFGRIQLVNAANAPAEVMKPLSGFKTNIEVEGTNMVWVRHMPGIRDAKLGGVRVFAEQYVLDEHFLEKLQKGVDNFSQDVDLIMPQFVEGMNKLTQHNFGLLFMASNGEKNVEVGIDNSDLKDPSNFTVLADLEHPSLGDKPVRAMMHADAINLAVTSITLFQRTPDGRFVAREISELPADTKVTPLFKLIKDDGTEGLCDVATITWNKGLKFTMDLLPPGEYEDVLVAETMTGAHTTVHFKYKNEVDDYMVKAKQSWRDFKSEMMEGDWDWFIPTDPITDLHVTMSVTGTKDPFAYEASLKGADKDGNPSVTKGILILEIHDQPFYRLILFPKKGEKPEVSIGTIWWTPRDGKAQIATRALGFDVNIIWVQKAGRRPGPGLGPGPGPIPQPVKNDEIPQGWHKIGDGNQIVSLAVPPAFAANENLIQQVRQQIYAGYDYLGLDPNTGASVEIVRFDGVHDFGQAVQLLSRGRQMLGIQFQTGQAQKSKIDGVECLSMPAQSLAQNGVPYTLGVNLIPTPKGIVALNFASPQQTFQAAQPTLQKILTTIRIAK